MFAIVATRNDRVWIARDPVGIKPLYLSMTGPNIRVSSEVKGAMFEHVLDEAGAFREFGRECSPGYSQRGETLAPSVRTLPRGSVHELASDFPGGLRPLATLERCPVHDMAPQPRELLPALRRAVERVLSWMDPVVVLSSGGVDSEVIVRLVRELGAAPLCLRLRASRSSTGARQRVVDGEVIHELHVSYEQWVQGVLPATWASEAPGDLASVAHWLCGRFAAEYGNSCLSGEGADELFCGYPSMRQRIRTRSGGLSLDIDERETAEQVRLEYLEDQLTERHLAIAEKACMASAVEVRFPYLDTECVRFALSQSALECARGLGKLPLRRLALELGLQDSAGTPKTDTLPGEFSAYEGRFRENMRGVCPTLPPRELLWRCWMRAWERGFPIGTVEAIAQVLETPTRVVRRALLS